VRGDEAQAWARLGELLEAVPGDPHVQLLAAEMAWARGEWETARGFWQGALPTAPAGSAARAWLVIEALSRGDVDAAVALGGPLRAADLPEAGALLALAAATDTPAALDDRFEPAALAGELQAWLGELERHADAVGLESARASLAELEAAAAAGARG